MPFLEPNVADRLKKRFEGEEEVPSISDRLEKRMEGIEPGPVDPMTQVQTAQQVDFTPTAQPLEQESYAPGISEPYARNEGLKIQQEATAKEGSIKAARADELYDTMVEGQRQADMAQADIIEKRQQEENEIASKRVEIDQKLEKYAQSNANVADMFADKSVGGKILMGLALFMGSAPNGTGQNQAVKVIERGIQADLDKQMKEIEGTKGIYSELKDEFGDRQTARYAAQDAILKKLQRELQIQGQKYENPLIAANTEKGLGVLQDQMDKNNQQMEMHLMKNRRQQMDLERFVPGQGMALTKDDAKKTKSYLSDSTTLKELVKEMKGLRKKQGGGEILNRSSVAKGKQLATEAALIMKNIAELGVLAGPDMDLLNKLIPEDPLSFSPTTMTKLQNLENMLERKERTFLKARGFQGGTDFSQFKGE